MWKERDGWQVGRRGEVQKGCLHGEFAAAANVAIEIQCCTISVVSRYHKLPFVLN